MATSLFVDDRWSVALWLGVLFRAAHLIASSRSWVLGSVHELPCFLFSHCISPWRIPSITSNHLTSRNQAADYTQLRCCNCVSQIELAYASFFRSDISLPSPFHLQRFSGNLCKVNACVYMITVWWLACRLFWTNVSNDQSMLLFVSWTTLMYVCSVL